jgi:outer membrane biosynthesis protein TonB
LLSGPKTEEPEKERPPERIVEILPPKEVVHARAAMGERKKSDDGGAAKGEAGKAAVAPPKTVSKPSAADSLRSANLGSLVNNLSSLSNSAAPSANTDVKVAAAAAQDGAAGFTTDGLKSGAGGKSVGIGRTVGQGEGGFQGTGKLGLSGNSLVEGSAGRGVTGPAQQGGGLDRAVIDQIVRRRQDRIRLCYERQLNFSPNLAGKVSVHFTIGADGQVVKAGIIEDTMKNQAVRDCIATEVKTWTFPRPSGGTLVEVDYPFVFESGGGGGG